MARRTLRMVIACALALDASALRADPSPADLVKNIRTGNSSKLIPQSTPVVGANGVMFLSGSALETGAELWKSDGTDAGTVLVKDIRPGAPGSSPQSLANVNGTVFFVADDGTTGPELWKSDGTEAGTVLVKEIVAGSSTSNPPQLLTAVNGTLFFTAYDAASGRELWKSDGTSAGTVRVKDIVPGSGSPSLSNLTNVNGMLFFAASNGSGGIGTELWKSDGSEAGTVLVKDINPGTGSSSPGNMANVNGTLYFRADDGTNGSELWKSDGTEAGTAMVVNASPGSSSSSFTSLIDVNGTLFFSGFNWSQGHGVWKSDGTAAGTVTLLAAAAQPVSALTLSNSSVYFGASDGAAHGYELWKTDGTLPGTALVKDIVPGSGAGLPGSFTDVNGTLFFRADDGTTGHELWKTDGTEAGTVLVKDIWPGVTESSLGSFVNLDGTLVFTAQDGTYTGAELWKSDGTGAGTVLVSVNAGGASSSPDKLTDVNGTLFFTAIDDTTGRELWKSDGTEAGTALVKDIGPALPNLSLGLLDLTNLNGTLYFGVTVNISNLASSLGGLWKSDGTDAGTQRVAFVSFGSDDVPRTVTTMNGMLFFGNSELWKSDGTEAGTVLVKEIVPGSSSSYPHELTNVDGTLFFVAQDTWGNLQLWKSDGTTAGTVFLKSLNAFPPPTPYEPSHDTYELTNVNGTLFFKEPNLASSRTELWKSDGTGAGTVVVRDFFYLSRLTNSNGALCFAAIDSFPSGGFGLWKSDGTGAGTVVVKPVLPQISLAPTAPPIPLTDAAGTLFFAASQTASGLELWKSNGTETGTVLVEDSQPGPGSSGVDLIAAAGSRVLYRSSAGSTREEPWTSDGTAAGTHPVADIAPTGGSLPGPFVQSGSRVFFAAQTNVTGRELYAVPVAALDDGDQDGLADANEAALGTNPDDADSDDDGLTDGAEVNTHGTNPLDADSDHDGLSDGYEIAHGSNPLDPMDPPVVPIPVWGLGALAGLLLATRIRARKSR